MQIGQETTCLTVKNVCAYNPPMPLHLAAHDQNQFDALDRLGSLKPSAELTMTTLALLEDIALASRPGTSPAFYRPVRESAVRLARAAYRQVIAMVAREDLRRLMAQVSERQRVTGPDTHQSQDRWTPGYWTGD